MTGWTPYPMIRIALFFTGGIVLGIYQPEIMSESGAVLLFVLAFALFCTSFFIKPANFFSGLSGLCAIFLGGFIDLLHHIESRNADHLLYVSDSIRYYAAFVNSTPEDRANSIRIQLCVSAVRTTSWKSVSGNIVLYISKKSTPQDLQYGDELLIEGSPQQVKPPANPGEFDFREFLAFKNIWHQHIVRSENIRIIRRTSTYGILYYSNQARIWSTRQIKKYVKGVQEQGIALALVLGVNDGLDNELQNSYAASGSLHVLSVSGLHVGIIYLIILFLLKPVQSLSWSRWLIAGVSIICLWSYAFVTGLSPSVLRAVTMFSFVALARPFGHRTNIYNTLAASVFLLLWYDPFLIMSVGFQLSYLAVLGIVYLQRPLYNLWSPTSWLLDKIWESTCISIAAQLATFALGLLYFHQFPVYFLIANLFVIPVSFLVLMLGIALLVVSSFASIASVAGMLLELSIKFLNLGVFTFEDLPFSIIDNVYITPLQCWLLMGLVVTWILFFQFRKLKYVIVATALCVVISIIAWQHDYATRTNHQWVVYSASGCAAMEWIDQGTTHVVIDSSLLHDKASMKFHIYPNRLQQGVDHINVNTYPESFRQFKGFSLFSWHGRYVLWITDLKHDLPDSIQTDYVLISHRAVSSLKQLTEKVRFTKLILDSSNSTWYSRKIIREANENKIPVHSVLEQGAFIVTM